MTDLTVADVLSILAKRVNCLREEGGSLRDVRDTIRVMQELLLKGKDRNTIIEWFEPEEDDEELRT